MTQMRPVGLTIRRLLRTVNSAGRAGFVVVRVKLDFS